MKINLDHPNKELKEINDTSTLFDLDLFFNNVDGFARDYVLLASSDGSKFKLKINIFDYLYCSLSTPLFSSFYFLFN